MALFTTREVEALKSLSAGADRHLLILFELRVRRVDLYHCVYSPRPLG
jgi:hypothetical protein